MRLIFIPGFGETGRIFCQIAPHLPGEHLFINNFDWLGNQPCPARTAIQYAQLLIDQHRITRHDWIIGHSMGGWIAYAIKHLTGCSIVQIASWTDPAKVVRPLRNPEHIYRVVRSGWYLNRVTKKLLLLRYRHQPSAAIFGEVFQNLIDSPVHYVINQLRIILNPPGAEITVRPDVIIHSQNDSIVRFPEHSAIAVPGDHFNLFTYPSAVVAVIRPVLESRNR